MYFKSNKGSKIVKYKCELLYTYHDPETHLGNSPQFSDKFAIYNFPENVCIATFKTIN